MYSYSKRTATAFALAAMASIVSAQSVLIDFGTDNTFRGLSTVNPDGNGNYWNNVDNSNFWANLVDTSNTPTTIDLGFDATFGIAGSDSYNGPAGPTDAGDIFPFTLQQWIDINTDIDQVALGNIGGSLNAVADYFVDGHIQVQQLDPTKVYDISFYGSHKFNADNITRYSIYSDSAFSQLVAEVDLEVGVDAAHNRDTLATLTNIPGPSNSNNIFYIKWTGASGGSGYLNALEITETGDFTPSMVTLADFGDNFQLDGFLPDSTPPDTSWNATSVTPGLNSLNVSSTGTGGGFEILPANFLNASATDTVELTIDVTTADSPNVVTLIEDGDGTQHRFSFGGLGVGQHVLTFPVDGVGQTLGNNSATLGNAGTVAGLDLTDLFAFQIAVETGETTSYDIDFISLKLIDGPDALVPGDFDGDGFVGLSDLNILGANWGTNDGSATAATGDADADGNVGLSDLNLLGANWNPPAAVAVPEPTSISLLGFFAVGIIVRRQHL